jgi:two-component system, OmpR family, phosphate regulon response regulator PhoB
VADGRKVLVVDEGPDVLLLCRVTLGFEGYQVTEASDGEEAMVRLREERPDVVLLDTVKPGLDGWQVLEAIRADEELRAIPVVLLTGTAQDQVRGWSAGAADHLAKPFSPLALSEVLQDVLATDRADEERRRQLRVDALQPPKGP